MHVEFLSSTPASATEGSGTFVALEGLARGLGGLGHRTTLRPLRVRTRFHTLDRLLYNVAVAARPPRADVVVGVDLDGFLWGRRPRAGAPGARSGGRPPFVVALKGIVADELRNERGWVKALLTLQARWERANTRGADRVVVPSRYSGEVARALYGVPADALAVVPEPVDVGGWRRRFAAAERRARSRPTVLCVARLYPRKRVEDLLRAAAILRARIGAIEIRIIGGGPELGRLRDLHAGLGLGDTVALLGEVSRRTLAVEYVNADCFCLPTVQEGFGLVFVEAMIAGLPVVACRAAAVPEVVDDRRTGLLVNPRSPDELAMAIETVLTNEGLRRDLGAAGGRRAETFDLEKVAARFLESLPRAPRAVA